MGAECLTLSTSHNEARRVTARNGYILHVHVVSMEQLAIGLKFSRKEPVDVHKQNLLPISHQIELISTHPTYVQFVRTPRKFESLLLEWLARMPGGT